MKQISHFSMQFLERISFLVARLNRAENAQLFLKDSVSLWLMLHDHSYATISKTMFINFSSW